MRRSIDGQTNRPPARRPAVIQSRAIDETGYVQPTLAETARGPRRQLHLPHNAIWPWRIAADGEVTNAEA
jgi:sulfane dehydrogenase subunit SoxC